MSRPARILLVEDDASLQRFVELALEELGIELQIVGRVGAALDALRAAPANLIITDLMLPDQSGVDLLAALEREPALRGQARVVVFSAGLSPTVRAQLAAHEVWRLLSKPCSVVALEDCVRDGLAQQTAPASSATATATATARMPATAETDPIEQHFGGNTELYLAFRASCLQQFLLDLKSGDLACAQGDAPALRRLAHSLKSVLLTLGADAASALAGALEHSAEQADWPVALPQWQTLRASIDQLR